MLDSDHSTVNARVSEMNRSLTSLQRLAAGMLASATLIMAPAAKAEVLTFEGVSNIVSPTLNSGDTVYSGGQQFLTGNFRMTVLDGPLAQLLGVTGLAGALIDGANPFNCAVLACPSGNASTYFGGLNDGAVLVQGAQAGAFHLNSLNFGFIAPVGGLDDGSYGQLRVTGILADGSRVTVVQDFPTQDEDGNFTFDAWAMDPAFTALTLTGLSIDACMFDGQGGCFNDVDNPAFNLAQFAIDDLDISLPLPGSAPLLLLGLAGLALTRRRRAQ
jgi:hypothetical protein